ncbi:hypothetical protein FSS13T_26800 [Flavobacterium saliperosum S13]|nr:hypothetical protein FSS13T_26800 [Flavobacterium saliperosum S13]
MYAAFAFMIVFGFDSCVVKHHHHKTVVVKKKRLPPGQAKKISGDRSARRHAPGHNK